SATRGFAMPDRPPLAHTGGFGEPTCHVCHWFYDPNSGPGTLEVSGLPDGFVPGKRYTLRVVLRQPDMRAAGFELAVRFAAGQLAGAQAGALASADDRSAVTDTLGVLYLHHVRAGTAPAGPDSTAWTFDWTAPDRPAAVRFDI